MLSRIFSFRHQTNTIAKTARDLRELINVGDSIRVKKSITKLQTVNRTALPGDEVLSTARMIDQIERLAAGMIEPNLGPNQHTTGRYIQIDHRKPVYLASECIFKAEVTEVTATEASFRFEILDARNGELIGSAAHSRVVVSISDEPTL
jgi:predicted thioesterase